MPPKNPDELTFTERARRAQIVAAAVEVLAHEGFKAASLTRIAEQAGISKGLILYHFAGKDDLLRQTLFDTIGLLAKASTDGLDFTLPPPRLLDALVHRSAHVGREHGVQRRAISRIIAGMGPDADRPAAVLPTDAEPLLASYRGLFAAGIASGDFRADLDVEVMAVTYSAAIDAMYAHFDAHPDVDPDDYADSLVDILLAACGSR